jgi:hypothetical protein
MGRPHTRRNPQRSRRETQHSTSRNSELRARQTSDPLQLRENRIDREDVAVLEADVDQALVMRSFQAIGDGFTCDDGVEPELAGVDRRRPDATARGAAGNDEGVNAFAPQLTGEIRREEANAALS